CSGTDNESLANDWNAANIAALESCVADTCDTDFTGQVTSDYDFNNLSPTCGQGGTIAVIYTITDDCGNATTLNATLTLEDTSAPDLTNCSVTDGTIECSGTDNETLANDWNAANIAALESCVADTCDTDFTGQITSDYDFNNLSSTCGQGGTIAVIYTITDDCGNATTLNATLTLEDTSAPDLTNCTVENTVLECSDTENEALADAWNAANIAALEACATDSCDTDFSGQVTSDYDFNNLNTTCGPCGTINVTYTVTDDCGNETSLTATLTFDDGTIPDLTNCSVTDEAIECDGDNNETLANNWNAANITALENCADDLGVTVTSNYDFNNLSSTCGLGGTIAVIYTITDDCGNATTLNATLTLEDSSAPDLTNCSVTDGTIECSGTDNESLANDWNAANIAALESCVADTCDTDFTGQVTSDYDFNNLSSTCGQGGTIAVIYTITDDCGNVTTLNATLTLEDTSAPDLTNCSVTDGTIECSGTDNESLANDWNAANIAALESCVADTCDTDFTGQVTSDYDFNNLSSTCGQGGTIAVIYTITDDCGNVTTLNATLTLEDTSAPDLTNCSVTDGTIECSGTDNETLANDWNAANIAALESCVADTCDTDFTGQVTSDYDFNNLSSTCGQGGTIAVIYTITDDCGNATTLNATLTLEDTSAPDLTNCTVENTVLECSDTENEALADAWNAANIAALEACATDSCDTDFSGQVTSDYDFENLSSTCGPCGTINVTYTITDDCGNATSLTATLTFSDETIPDLTNCSVTDEAIECDGDNNETLANNWNAANIIAIENCADDLGITVTSDYSFPNLVPTCGQGGTIAVVYTVIDDCGNATSLSATLIIEDTTNPTIDTPASDLTVECDGNGNSADLQDWLDNNGGGAVASDACSNVTWTNNFSALSDECGETGSATVTFTATDACGNTANTSAIFTIVDTTIPNIETQASDLTVQCDGNGNSADLQDWLDNNGGGAVASDACSNVTWTNNFSALSDECGETGSATVTFTATDACGNTANTSAIFTIVDTTIPNIETQASDLTVECDGTGNISDLQNWLDTNGGAIASDSCSDITWTNDFSALSDECGLTGSANVTFSVTDECGNMVDTTATFTIVDTSPPVLTSDFEDIINVVCDDIPGIPNLEFQDACSQMSVIAPDPDNEVIEFIDNDNYQIIRTWTVSDDCMNTNTYIQTINVSVESQVQTTDTELCIIEDFDFDLFSTLSGNFDTDGVWTVTAGDVTIDGSFFNPSTLLDINGGFTDADLGDYMFTYTVGGDCPSITDVIITINDDCVVLPCGEDDVIISKAVTPSVLDGVNDVFAVTGIEDCGFVIELQIFNRWGAKIYDNSNYKNDWNGQSSGASVGNSGFVPTGTYYYIIKLKGSTGDLELKPITGPIYVSTN
ncbi:gliding motility-associated C-terminal domain-containing protein, partial [Psychroserpens mesophilus]|uniref:gliding motility-associated C-terminal domain-containing protein n=1 Tax=Psychroserpens mesophilus TaxID=325473 RepID=UPI003D659519